MNDEWEMTTGHALTQVALRPLMKRTQGAPSVIVAVVDGPVSPITEREFHRRAVRHGVPDACTANERACGHGTFVAALLAADRRSPTPGICPSCTILLYSIFQGQFAGARIPTASIRTLSRALVDAIAAGARVINLSLAVARCCTADDRTLHDALDLAAHEGVIVVAAAGNQPIVGSSALLRHPWVIPVAGCDQRGMATVQSSLGPSIGKGLMAPATRIMSLGVTGAPVIGGGTSVAAAFVTGAVALLWSERVTAPAVRIKDAILQPHNGHRRAIVPPLLNAWSSHQLLTREPSRMDINYDKNCSA